MKGEKKLEFKNLKIEEILNYNNIELYSYLYIHEYPKVRSYILSNNGKLDDVDDVFQEIMLILFNKYEINDFTSIQASALIIKIAKNIWLQTFRKRKPATCNEVSDNIVDNSAYDAIINLDGKILDAEETVENLIIKHIKMLNDDNRRIFLLYINRYRAKRIAEIMGYNGGENYVRKKIRLCKLSLLHRIKNDPEFKTL
ncbi:MAG: hypothetical protein LBP67_03000 [Bacteroidales bacterium]|jgi:DNA-directed RNA polymerase specialized sigma24 family protein|nr:hypothetical protein [Bacteroidales bacterium]